MPDVINKPERPKGDECCGEGCCPCIWDIYFDALDRWEEQQEKLQERLTETEDTSR